VLDVGIRRNGRLGLERRPVASSFCPMTGVKGIGRGPTFETAVDNAIKACIAKGGVSSCCYKFTRKVS
jgi:hypothetical protein